MKEKFNIKITDNETGEVIQEANTNAIIGGYATEEGAAGLACSSCGAFTLAAAINAAETAIADNYKNHPGLKLLTTFMAAKSSTEKVSK